jgi:hypothetical protein
MPIRLNLLAEAQAVEEQRRRDPAKRAVWLGTLAVVAALVWSSSLQLRVMMAKGELTNIEGQMNARSKEYEKAVKSLQKLTDVRRKLTALQQLTTNRFLQGTALNALQQTALEEVQLRRFKTEQVYAYVAETKAMTNENTQITPGKPASVVEKIVITMDARDISSPPGDQVNKFKQSVAESAYFQSLLCKTNEVRLISLSPPGPGDVPEKSVVAFTLECRLPERHHL